MNTKLIQVLFKGLVNNWVEYRKVNNETQDRIIVPKNDLNLYSVDGFHDYVKNFPAQHIYNDGSSPELIEAQKLFAKTLGY